MKQLKPVQDITPKQFSCFVGACPSVFESEDEFIIVGRRLAKIMMDDVVQKKIGDKETAVAIPKSLLSELFLKK